MKIHVKFLDLVITNKIFDVRIARNHVKFLKPIYNTISISNKLLNIDVLIIKVISKNRYRYKIKNLNKIII